MILGNLAHGDNKSAVVRCGLSITNLFLGFDKTEILFEIKLFECTTRQFRSLDNLRAHQVIVPDEPGTGGTGL